MLYQLQYVQHDHFHSVQSNSAQSESRLLHIQDKVFSFPLPKLDIIFDDGILQNVKEAWKRVLREDARDEDFMNFEGREGVGDDDDGTMAD